LEETRKGQKGNCINGRRVEDKMDEKMDKKDEITKEEKIFPAEEEKNFRENEEVNFEEKLEGEQEKEEESPEAKEEEYKRQLEEKSVQAQDYFNRLLRLQADFENFRKRVIKEREEIRKFAAEDLIMQLLPVVDNFERALSFGRENMAGFFEGVEMIYKQLNDLLKTQGVVPVPTLGEKFDPAMHEAVAQEEAPEEQDNLILEEFCKGYYLNDKIIRPAMVKVARAK